MPINAVNKIPSKGKIHSIAKIRNLQKTPFHRSGGRQTAAFFQQIEECGSLPRSRYAGFAEISEHKKVAEHFRGLRAEPVAALQLTVGHRPNFTR